MVWKSAKDFAFSRLLTCAGSPENRIYYSPLKIKPSGGLLSGREVFLVKVCASHVT